MWRTLDGVKHLLFGCKGGEFCGTDGKYLQVIDAVPAAAGVLAFSQCWWCNGSKVNVSLLSLAQR